MHTLAQMHTPSNETALCIPSFTALQCFFLNWDERTVPGWILVLQYSMQCSVCGLPGVQSVLRLTGNVVLPEVRNTGTFVGGKQLLDTDSREEMSWERTFVDGKIFSTLFVQVQGKDRLIYKRENSSSDLKTTSSFSMFTALPVGAIDGADNDNRNGSSWKRVLL